MKHNSKSRPRRAWQLRAATLLFPPLGLWLLWRDWPSLRQRVVGTLGIVLYSFLYATAVIWLMVRFTPLEVEWRGGFPPVLTFRKTLPDYDAVERHRAAQAPPPGVIPKPETSPAYWTDFRGPNRDGHYAERSIATNWPAGGLPELWRQPIGGGYASFVVAQGLAFTIEQRRQHEVVTAYDVETGVEVWAHSWPGDFRESMGGDGPRATPTWHAGRLYALGAEGELRCLDAATGQQVWRKNILSDNGASNLLYGMSASPLVVDEKLIVLPGGAAGRSVVAYHKETGERIWSALDDQQAYTAPMLVTLSGQRQLLVVSAKRAAGLAVEDGKLLWEFPWRVQYDNSIAQPILVGSDRFVLSAGYGTGCVAVQITRAGDQFSARELWRNKNLKNKFTSSVFWRGYIYGLDESILTCIDAETGARQWKDGRYEYGQVLLASGHLIVLSGEGDLALVKAIPERHVELARFRALPGKTWNHPAIHEGKLLVRNSVEMAAYDLSTGTAGATPSEARAKPDPYTHLGNVLPSSLSPAPFAGERARERGLPQRRPSSLRPSPPTTGGEGEAASPLTPSLSGGSST